MLSKSAPILALAAAGALAATPSGFEPASQTELFVNYNGIAAVGGMAIAKEATQNEPMLGTAQKMEGEFAVIMIDLDIPTNSPPQTSTLLHWMQLGLTSQDQATMFNTTMGQNMAFMLENKANTPAAAPYLGPSPPARIPLSHRYTQILVETSGIQSQAMNTLMTAAMTRQAFDVMQVLMTAGLMDKVMAGNFFNVTNPGPASSNATSTGGGRGSASGSTTFGMPSPTTSFTAGASIASQVSGLLGLVGVAALFLGL